MTTFRLAPADWLARLPGPEGARSVMALEHGSVTIKLYAPRGHDPQHPHVRDEIYIVVSGRGMFAHGQRRDAFGPGDFLFASAGLAHRFEEFTDDLAVWVIFYGPDGGEQPASASARVAPGGNFEHGTMRTGQHGGDRVYVTAGGELLFVPAGEEAFAGDAVWALSFA